MTYQRRPERASLPIFTFCGREALQMAEELPTVMIDVTAMMMPSTVKSDRILLAQICTKAVMTLLTSETA